VHSRAGRFEVTLLELIDGEHRNTQFVELLAIAAHPFVWIVDDSAWRVAGGWAPARHDQSR
jgi:hypothetical protein